LASTNNHHYLTTDRNQTATMYNLFGADGVAASGDSVANHVAPGGAGPPPKAHAIVGGKASALAPINDALAAAKAITMAARAGPGIYYNLYVP
jgi:hypothetical protein